MILVPRASIRYIVGKFPKPFVFAPPGTPFVRYPNKILFYLTLCNVDILGARVSRGIDPKEDRGNWRARGE